MEKLKQLFSRVMQIDEGAINDDTSPENTESWDSFNGLMLVSELEQNFGVKFTMDEVNAVKKYADIKEALKMHNIPEEDYL